MTKPGALPLGRPAYIYIYVKYYNSTILYIWRRVQSTIPYYNIKKTTKIGVHQDQL